MQETQRGWHISNFPLKLLCGSYISFSLHVRLFQSLLPLSDAAFPSVHLKPNPFCFPSHKSQKENQTCFCTFRSGLQVVLRLPVTIYQCLQLCVLFWNSKTNDRKLPVHLLDLCTAVKALPCLEYKKTKKVSRCSDGKLIAVFRLVSKLYSSIKNKYT